MGRSLVWLWCLASCTPEAVTTISSNVLCVEEECGSNSTVIDGVYFWESNFLHKVNSEGVTLLGFENLPAGAVALTVDRDRLRAVTATGHMLSDPVTDSRLRFDVNGVIYVVEITAVHNDVHYIANQAPNPLETYKLTYTSLITGRDNTPLCETAEVGEGEASFDAFFFEGDRYDPITRDVIHGSETKGWFNIACLGGAPAKTLQLRAAIASNPAAAKVDTKRFQAAFSMWSAEYCGDGTPYTVPGEPLRVKDRAGWIPPLSGWSWASPVGSPGGPSSYEAVWGPDGAVCLDTPRRADNYDGADGELAAKIRAHCLEVDEKKVLPPCTDSNGKLIDWQAAGYYLTANP
jgi:hypothetical protein